MVVGKDGKVAFVGSPNAELDTAILAALGKDAADPAAKAPGAKEPASKSPGTKPVDGVWKRGDSAKQPSEALEPGTTEEVTSEPTDEKGESTSESTSSSSSWAPWQRRPVVVGTDSSGLDAPLLAFRRSVSEIPI